MSFDLRASLRRLKPDKIAASLQRRDDGDLPFVVTSGAGVSVLLDKTVYIDAMRDRLPDEVAQLIRAFVAGTR